MKNYYIYILANKKNGTLYIGVTSNLIRRVYEHKHNNLNGFTRKYSVKRLVYYELVYKPDDAIRREKQLKSWRRAWKIALIEKENFLWEDLYQKVIDSGSSPE